MDPLFNKFGQPNQSVVDIANELESTVRNFLNNLIIQGYSATDIRAAGGYLAGLPELATSCAIMDLQHKIHEDIKKNADPNPSQEEIAFILQNEKIKAIKSYRERTASGLKESKDVIEHWINCYNEVKKERENL